jgi:hypothetical protein
VPSLDRLSLSSLKQIEVLTLLRGAEADRLQKKITDRVALRLAPRVEKRRGHHEVFGVQEKQARDQVFLVRSIRR